MKHPPDSRGPVEANHAVQHRHPGGVRFCALCGGELEPREVLPELRVLKVCKSCGYIDFPGPKLAAGCLVIDRGRVLLLRRGNEPRIGYWTFPGGYVDLGETPEEVGIEAEVSVLHGVYMDAGDPRVIVIVYRASGGADPQTSAEASEARYFAPDEIPWPELAFSTTHQALNDWLASSARD